jgi:hypothetical protein
MSKWVFILVQFFPVSAFATFAFWYGVPSNDRWLVAFQFGALLGVIQLAVLLPTKSPLNRLVLAVNVYLILGGLSVLFNQWWYLQIYDLLRESAILLLMLIIGLVTTFSTNSGFIAVKASKRKFSIYMLMATCVMLLVSIYFRGDRVYAAVLPIIFLSIFQRLLAYAATNNSLGKSDNKLQNYPNAH